MKAAHMETSKTIFKYCLVVVGLILKKKKKCSFVKRGNTFAWKSTHLYTITAVTPLLHTSLSPANPLPCSTFSSCDNERLFTPLRDASCPAICIHDDHSALRGSSSNLIYISCFFLDALFHCPQTNEEQKEIVV